MKYGLDTSFVIRYITATPANLAEVAFRFLQKAVANGEEACVSSLVISEVYFALQHHYGATKKESIVALRNFFALRGITSMGALAQVLLTPRLESAKPGLIDRLIHSEYADQGIRLITFEKSAVKLPATDVLHADS